MKPSTQIINKLLEASGKQQISIAFCPYKYSMWDCMEPVYRSAWETPGVHADIIPLTYETLPAHQWQNESDSFLLAGYKPLELDALHSCQYDYIVIHYPYDRNNILTKLDAMECVDVLKQIAKVVYIPYHGNIAGPEWSRFYKQPGARESDFICLGSSLDVDAFQDVSPNYSGTIIYTNGSTKAECAEMHKGDPIPEQYKDIKHPVTLICGTLHTFSQDPEGRMAKHMEKIKEELANHNTVIYRPHPLVYEAIAVMRPEYLKQYQAFLEEVSVLVDVLDGSPFLHNAMRVADKLICDPSSVQRTWIGTGKPIEVMT